MLDDRAAFSTRVKEMVGWFRANYRPAEEYFDIGNDCRDILMSEFHQDLETRFRSDHAEEIIDDAVDEIERGDEWAEWAEINPRVLLLRAHPHQWGRGHVHRFYDGGSRTLCGRTLETCPGVSDWGRVDEVDCKSCLSVLSRQEEPEP